MDVYRTEEEQIEAIKKYASEHGVKLVVTIVACITLFFGYQTWEKKQLSSKHTVSMYYNEMTEALGSDEKITKENRAKFDTVFEKILKEYPKSIYASYASLHKAKLEVDADEFDKAAQSLQWVVDAAVNPELVALANLRLARVEFAKGDLDKALTLLNKDTGPFTAEYEEVKGDILLEKEQPEQALLAYKKAKNLVDQAGGVPNRILDMKIESLEKVDESKLFPVPAEKSTVADTDSQKEETK